MPSHAQTGSVLPGVPFVDLGGIAGFEIVQNERLINI